LVGGGGRGRRVGGGGEGRRVRRVTRWAEAALRDEEDALNVLGLGVQAEGFISTGRVGGGAARRGEEVALNVLGLGVQAGGFSSTGRVGAGAGRRGGRASTAAGRGFERCWRWLSGINSGKSVP
jgi:hypothetical protein